VAAAATVSNLNSKLTPVGISVTSVCRDPAIRDFPRLVLLRSALY
jgi:hypothetical protein